jgi:hypothetical protein
MDPAFSAGVNFDAAAVWHVKSYDAYVAAYKDPYYIDVIEPDEQNFVDKGQMDGKNPGKVTVVRAMSTIGVYRYIIKDGKPAVDVSDDIWEKFNSYSYQKGKL